MGIQISKPVKKLKPHITLDRTDHEVPCRVKPIKSAESQRNGNATKLIEHDRTILFSPIPTSPACSLFSTISSHRPRLGTSPAEQTKHRSTADMTSNEDKCWLKQNYNPQLYNSHLKLQNDTRPPWKPCSVISNRYERQVMHTNGSTNSRCVFTEFPYRNESRLSRKPKKFDRKSVSSSLTVLCDGRLQLGEAHLRRCTAAQQVQATKPDILDSLSGHNHNKTNLRTPFACEPGKLYTLKKNCTTTTSGNCNTTNKGKQTTCIVNESFKNHAVSLMDPGTPSAVVQQATDGDTFPLRYQFYIEDKPSTVRAFTNRGKLTALARDSHCHVHIQAQYKQPILFGQNVQSDTSRPHRIMRPILYYQGKRVRPVTVAARNISELRQFLDLLDSHYPELEENLFENENKSFSNSPPPIDDEKLM